MDRAPLIDREHLLRNLKVDAADTLLLTIPNQLGVDYNLHVLESHRASPASPPEARINQHGDRSKLVRKRRLTRGLYSVEPRGLEPLTPCLQSRCATNCAMAPHGRTADARSYVTWPLTIKAATASRAASFDP